MSILSSLTKTLPSRADFQIDSKPPSYDPYLKAFHGAFAPELEAAVARYKTLKRARILDLPCGDGFYTAIFTRHMNGGELVAADLSLDYLDEAKRTAGSQGHSPEVKCVQADAYHLPFDDESFDMVWCAQSMISLKEPIAALREMKRVLKPRGVVAVLETDEYHHILLPWPLELELAIQRATRSASRRKYGHGGKLAQSRYLRAALIEAGLSPTRKQSIVADRQFPFDEATRRFLREHFQYLRKFIRPELPAAEAELFDRFTAEDGPEGLHNREDGELTCLATVSHARR